MTTPNLPRLQKLLLLALKSTNEGEAAGAIHAINRVLAKGGVDAHWLVEKLNSRPSVPWQLDRSNHGADTDERLAFCCEDHSMLMLSERELEFILSLSRRRNRYSDWRPTPRQAQWLRDIYARLKLTRRD